MLVVAPQEAVALLCVLLCAHLIHCSEFTASDDAVHDLTAEPDYRAVRLKWKYQSQKGLLAFDIRYCEITNWQTKSRCKEQVVPLVAPLEQANADGDEPVIDLSRLADDTFEASITNLRMLTNYSIAVWPHYGTANWKLLPDRQSGSESRPQVLVETKSFAAKTSRCLANSSDIEVQTGPYFRGKISVEGSSNPSCAIYGNRSSSQSVYQFTINHDQCGSKVINNTRMETMVIVHENKEILTHNSRRYMVVCTFSPEIYSLTASVSVPNHLLKKLFDRIREKQFQLSLRARSNGQVNETRNDSTTGEKTAKSKRYSIRRQELQSHLRDSRMLAEDNRAKWLKQSNSQGGRSQWRIVRSLLADNKLAIVSVMAWCAIGLVCLLLVVKLRRSVGRLATQSDMKSAQLQGSSVEKAAKQTCIVAL